MPISKQSLLAVVRAARPTFRNRHDRIAFAVHAYLLADGYKLVAAGRKAEDTEGLTVNSEEVGLDGWTSLDSCYAFQYVDTTGKRLPVALKALVMGDQLLVHWLALGRDKVPASVALQVQKFTTDDTDLSQGYQNLEELIDTLHTSFQGTQPSTSMTSGARTQASTALLQGTSEDTCSPSQDHGASGHNPFLPRIGGDDVVPLGLRPPGMGPGPFGPGGLPGVPGMGGGMHMGPNDPLFAGRVRQPHRGGLPPGVHWDPINPPGMEGFNPGDFQRPGRQGGRDLHPDLAQPGPGSTHWDSMYG